jgi:hypothetical protein
MSRSLSCSQTTGSQQALARKKSASEAGTQPVVSDQLP